MSSYLFVSRINCRCDCGVKLRLPEHSREKQYCPQCHRPIDIERHATGEPPVMIRFQVSSKILNAFMKWHVKHLQSQELTTSEAT